jgi:hypothetical protein
MIFISSYKTITISVISFVLFNLYHKFFCFIFIIESRWHNLTPSLFCFSKRIKLLNVFFRYCLISWTVRVLTVWFCRDCTLRSSIHTASSEHRDWGVVIIKLYIFYYLTEPYWLLLENYLIECLTVAFILPIACFEFYLAH